MIVPTIRNIEVNGGSVTRKEKCVRLYTFLIDCSHFSVGFIFMSSTYETTNFYALLFRRNYCHHIFNKKFDYARHKEIYLKIMIILQLVHQYIEL